MITETSVYSPLAQLVRVSGLHPEGRRFESYRDYSMGEKLKWYKLLPVKQRTAGSNPASPAMNSKRIGNIGEAKVLVKFVELEVPVYTSFGDNEKSDMIADFNGKLNRIQCKTSKKFEGGKITFDLVSSTVHRTNGVKHKYNESEIDYFALHNIDSDITLLVPISVLSERTQVTFSIPYKPNTNQHTALNYEDYLFDKIVNN